jgi:hypothetical protein
MPDGGTRTRLLSRTSDVSLPPYARRLDVRATRAAFAAGTLGTVSDDATGVDEQGCVEPGDADGYDPHDVKHKTVLHVGSPWHNAMVRAADQYLPEAELRERWRQAFLRRVQYVDPRERRA